MLDELDRGRCADDLESYWLEFKPSNGAKEDKKVAIEYAVCFANAEGGAVVFGVSDHERGGQAQAIHGSGSIDCAQWERDIYASTRPHLTVQVDEVPVLNGEKRLVIVRVPRGESPPYGTSQGLYNRRVSKNCMPLDLQSPTEAFDWSGQPIEDAGEDVLDPVEIARARNWLRVVRPRSELIRSSDHELLQGLRAIHRGRVTRAGLLLFGKPEELGRRCPQHIVQYVYQSSDTQVTRNDQLTSGLLSILEQIETAFTGPANPEHELSMGLFKLRIPAFPVEDSVREAILNAVTHRDYTVAGRVLIRHTPREVVISNPGGFVGGITPENILRHEPQSRNQTLAWAFVKLGLVEQAGVGRRRIFLSALKFGKRLPVYETDGDSVTLRLFDGAFDERMAQLVARWQHEGRDINLDELMVLNYLREHAFINTESASKLLQLARSEARGLLDRLSQPASGILDRRGNTSAATFHLTKAVARDLLGKTAFTKNRGISPARYAEMVRTFVSDHGSVTPAECRELLGLGESNSDKVTISRLLRKWCQDDGFLIREGQGRYSRYRLRN